MKRKKISAPVPDKAETTPTPGRASRLAWIVAVLWALCVFAFFSSRKGRMLELSYWMEFFDLLPMVPTILWEGLGLHLLQLAGMWFLFICAGSMLIRWLRLNGMTRLESRLIGAGLGAGTISLTMLGLGLAGLWRPGLLRGIFYASLAICSGLVLLNAWRRREPKAPAPLSSNPAAAPRELPGFFAGASVGLILLAVIMNVLATAAPETFYDALVYHLGLPKLYLLRGRIVPTPENVFSGMPFGVEMLYGLALALADENLASLLHCSFGVATTLTVWTFLRRHASGSASTLGALLYYLSPLILYGSWQCGVDVTAGFYLILALLLFFAPSPPEPESRPWIRPCAAGMLLGFAMGVKYTVLPMAAVLAIVFYWLRRRAGDPTAAGKAGIMSAVAAAAFLPWLIKNVIFYGNPLYPFLNAWVGWAAPADWKGFLADAHSRDLPKMFTSLAGWKAFFTEPWTMVVASRTLDDWPGLAFLLFIPWAICLRWGIFKRDEAVTPAWTAVAVTSAGGYLIWCLTSELVRFLVMALPFLSCLAALAFSRAVIPAWVRNGAWLLLLLSCMYNFQVTFKMGQDYFSGRWSALRGRMTRSDYLKSPHMAYPIPPYAAFEFINQNLPPEAKVLFLGEERGFYCERDFIAPTVFDHNPFWVAVREADSAEGLRDRIRSLGITHILVNTLFLRARSNRPSVVPPDLLDGKVLNDFWSRYLETVFEERKPSGQGGFSSWLVIYKIRGERNDDSRSAPLNIPRDVILATLSAMKREAAP